MEPQLIDYYHEMPHGIHVIDKMNEELSDLQDKYQKLSEKYFNYVKTHRIVRYEMPRIRINTIDELKIRAQKIYNSVSVFKKIIYDFLNHEGWILEYDEPNRGGKDIMGYAGCGFWDTWETDELKWGNTSAQMFYAGELCNTQYHLYLKCKILDELYKLFPEYTERQKGWFHQQIDESFNKVRNVICIILENNCNLTSDNLHDIIYKTIMEQLFGWGGDGSGDYEDLFPFDYQDDPYIQNIVFYKCSGENDECGCHLNGEDFMETSDYSEGYHWYYLGMLLDDEYAFICPNCG